MRGERLLARRDESGLGAFIVRRLALGILVLFGVSILTFCLSFVIPADPAAKWAGPRATAQQIEQARRELGLDRPIYVQYARYIWGVLHGDLGRSVRTRQPVLDDIKAYLPATLDLILVGMVLGLAVGLPLGLAAGVRKDTWVDHLCRVLAVGSVSLPTFWLAMALQLVFFRWLGWLPLGGRLSNMVALTHPIRTVTGSYLLDSLLTGNWVALGDTLVHILLPALTLAAYPIGLVARQMRSSLLEVINEDYIRVAYAYGLPPRVVVYLYALKNAFGPTLTVLALSAGYSLVNTFLIEAVFNWPGLGNYTAMAVVSADFSAIMGVTLIVALVYVFLNLAVDLILAIDPRVRL